jgi:lysozyme family protein
MAARSYDTALARLLVHEGGYSNHPDDPGGPTNFGITLADYRRYAKPDATAADVRAMAVEEAKAIYRRRYWDALRCDDLPAGIDYAVFDYGVNSGIGRSGKVLRRALGMSDASAKVTDVVIAAARAADSRAVIVAICDERLRFLESLKTWDVFGHGWGRRVAEVRATSLAMAQTPVARAPTPLKAGGAAVVAGGAATAAHQASLAPAAVVAIAVVAALAAALLIHIATAKKG